MATYPIKMLKDEQNIPFVPLVSTEGIQDPEGLTLEQRLSTKLGPTNLHGGTNISVRTEGYDCYIDLDLPSSLTIIDNLTTSTSGQGALDAHQGYVLKGMIDNLPTVIDDITSTSQTDALSANQGRVLNINKQDKLISGTNLKTINNESLLGSGNITVVINNLNGDETSLAPSIRAVKNDLIQSGSNNNGSWIKYPDGTMICYNRIVGEKFNCSTRYTGIANSFFYRDDNNVENNKTWTFPIEFQNIPVVSINVSSSAYSMTSIGSLSKSYVSGDCALPYPVQNITFTWNFIAIGKWK